MITKEVPRARLHIVTDLKQYLTILMTKVLDQSGVVVQDGHCYLTIEQCGVVEVTPLSQCFFMEEHS